MAEWAGALCSTPRHGMAHMPQGPGFCTSGLSHIEFCQVAQQNPMCDKPDAQLARPDIVPRAL